VIVGNEKVRSAPQIEAPQQEQTEPALERRKSREGEESGDQISVGRGPCQVERQLWGHNARNQKRESDESSAVEKQDRAEPGAPGLRPECGPEVVFGNEAPGDEAERNGQTEEEKLVHDGLGELVRSVPATFRLLSAIAADPSLG
jgi:hypothetical protein